MKITKNFLRKLISEEVSKSPFIKEKTLVNPLAVVEYLNDDVLRILNSSVPLQQRRKDVFTKIQNLKSSIETSLFFLAKGGKGIDSEVIKNYLNEVRQAILDTDENDKDLQSVRMKLYEIIERLESAQV